MAKVVGRDESAVKRVTCRSCAAIVEYAGHEIKENRYTDYGGGAAGNEWIVCPGCGKDITLKSW